MSKQYISKYYEPTELMALPEPDSILIKDDQYRSYQKRKNAVTLALTGTAITKAARMESVCPKSLKLMLLSFEDLAPDGHKYCFRVCIPNFKYVRFNQSNIPAPMPELARPNAFYQFLQAQPKIVELINNFNRPISSGRPPKAFDVLHKKIVTFLKQEHLGGYYPLNTKDEGRRALHRYIKNRNISNVLLNSVEIQQKTGKKYSSLSDIFEPQLYDRIEIDAHRIDIDAVICIDMPNGGKVFKQISSLWLIVMIECLSRAILGWELRVGKSYDRIDLLSCIASSMIPWTRRNLIASTMVYGNGAGMPSGLSPEYALRRGILLALDNAKSHLAHDVEDSFCNYYDGYLNPGRPYTPEIRGIIEQFFSRVEVASLREVPGGYEPTKKLGEKKKRISKFKPEKHPFQIKVFEDLLEVIITGYNATPHPSIGNLSPLQYLQVHGSSKKWFFDSVENEICSQEMICVSKFLTIRGSRNSNTVPHVNYEYVRYRSSSLDYARELVGKKVLAKINLKDLRAIQIFKSPKESLGLVYASPPWHLTTHSATTRKMIMQWSRDKKLDINGAECAVSAYVEFLKSENGSSPKVVDQLVRANQIYSASTTFNKKITTENDYEIPRRGWISMDNPKG